MGYVDIYYLFLCHSRIHSYQYQMATGRTGWRSEREGGERDPPGGEKREAWVEGSNNSGGGEKTGERPERVHRTWDEDGRPTGSAGYYSSRGGRGGHHPNRRTWDENDSLPEW